MLNIHSGTKVGAGVCIINSSISPTQSLQTGFGKMNEKPDLGHASFSIDNANPLISEQLLSTLLDKGVY